MDNKKTDKSLVMCVLSCFIPFACYGVERLVSYQNLANASLALGLAFGFTALTGVLYFVISKIDKPFYGLFSAIFAFKMMPPVIGNLIAFSLEGSAVYSLVQMASLVLFGALIVKHFVKIKNSDTPIDVLPIIMLVFVMLILREPASGLYTSLYYLAKQSLMGVYITQALIYLWAVLIIYVTTARSNATTVKFVANFEIVAMIINILRRLGTIVFCLINHAHISMSYYCWIVIYLFVMLVFALLKKKATQKAA